MTVPLKCFRQTPLDQIHANLLTLLTKYKEDNPWLDQYFGNAPWSSDTPLFLPTGTQLMMPENGKHHDLENTIRMHTALRHLTIAQATDERLWAWMTHTQFWQYMRVRWPVEKYMVETATASKIAINVRDRYFFSGNRDRALVHNGLARLWWYGFVSFDASRDDPYELTAVLLQKLDIAQSLLERSVSRNPAVTRAVLRLLVEQKEAGRDYANRANFRSLVKHLNRLGGVAVLDLLSEDEIKFELEKKVMELHAVPK